MEVLCVILARGNSSRVPGKNKLVIGGKPCVVHAIHTAQESRHDPHVVVLSDDDETLHIAKLAGAEALIEPDYLAKDDNIYHALGYATDLCESRYGTYGAVGLLWGNVVMRPVGIMDQLIDKLLGGGCDSVGGVTPVPSHFHPFIMLTRDFDGRARRWCLGKTAINTQDFPPIHCDAAAGTCMTRRMLELLREDRYRIGELVSSTVIVEPKPIEIDTPEDVAWAEFLISRQGAQSCHRPT